MQEKKYINNHVFENIIFNKYPKDFILEPCLYSQLRALGVKLIFPKPEDLSYNEYLHKNSLNININ